VGAEFQHNYRPSPFHIDDNSNKLVPEFESLFKAWENEDPPVDKAAAIVVEHICYLIATAEQSQNLLHIQKAHLIAMAFFFAMRPCEFSKVPDPGLVIYKHGSYKSYCLENDIILLFV
jgi:hypothetical protein